MKMLRAAATQSKPAAMRVLRSIPRMLTSTAVTPSTAGQDDGFAFSGVDPADGSKAGGFGVGESPQQKILGYTADNSSTPSLLRNRLASSASPQLSAKKMTVPARATKNGPSAKKSPAAWNASFLDFVDSIDEPRIGGV